MPDINLLSQQPSLLQPRPAKVRPPAELVREMLLGEGTYATTLLQWYVDRWGSERDDDDPKRIACLYWAPETIRLEIEEVTGVKLPKANFDKLMAMITILTTDLFYNDVQRFIELANILAGDDFQPDEFEPADSVECAWAIVEALLNDPPDEQNPEPFSDEIRRYLGVVLKEEGYVTPPDILKLALDGDFSPQVNQDLADDPEMFQAVYEGQQAKAAEVTSVLRDGMTELLAQLEALPLENGSVNELKAKLRKAIT